MLSGLIPDGIGEGASAEMAEGADLGEYHCVGNSHGNQSEDYIFLNAHVCF